MPPKAKPDYQIVRWLKQTPDGQLHWTDWPPVESGFTKVLAYGWSDGLVTWVNKRA